MTNTLNYHTIIVCADYVDMLQITYPYNKNSLENISIISSFYDSDTAEFCNKNGIFLYQTNDFYKNGNSFNKAAAMNSFLLNCYKNRLQNDEWILFTDADIIFTDPIEYIKTLIKNTKDNYEVKVFSCPRIVYKDEQALVNNERDKEQNFNINYCGYFQFFHKSIILNKLDDGIAPIPEYHNASTYDLGFIDIYFPNGENKCAVRKNAIHVGQCGRDWDGKIKR